MLYLIRFARTRWRLNGVRQSLWIFLIIAATACGPTRSDRPYKKPVADGWEHFRLGEFDLASRDFQQAAAAPATEAAGLFGLAQTWHLRQPNPDPAQAAALYQQVMARAPHSEYAAWSALALAWLQAVPPGQPLPEIATVAAGFQEALNRFPDHPAGHEAFLALQALQLQGNTPDRWREVLAALDGFLQAHPTTLYASAIQTLRAHCYRMLDEPAHELAVVRQAWQLEQADPLGPQPNPVGTYWRIATISEFDLGDFATAREYYRRLIAEYPAEQRVFLAKQELQRMDEIEARIRQELAGGGR